MEVCGAGQEGSNGEFPRGGFRLAGVDQEQSERWMCVVSRH